MHLCAKKIRNMKLSRFHSKILVNMKPGSAFVRDNAECVLFGSGPSLDTLDPSANFLRGKDLIGCNFVHSHDSLKGKKFKLYSLIDRDYTAKIGPSFFDEVQSDTVLVTSKNVDLLCYKDLFRKNVRMIKTRPYRRFELETDIQIVSGKRLLTGNSMPFLIQCAAFLFNYKTIYIYGVDHYDFEQLDNCENFSNYFGRSVKSLNITSEKLEYINSMYDYVGRLCSDLGIKVYNVTPESKLMTFEKLNIPGLVK